MPESQNPVLNLAHLQSIVGTNPESLKELLPIFVVNINELIDKLENASMFENLDEWQKVTHRMKGVAANFGFIQLQHLCGEAEKNDNPAALKQLFPPIQQAVGQTRIAIEDALKNL